MSEMAVMNQAVRPRGIPCDAPKATGTDDKAPEIPQLLMQLAEWLKDLHGELGLLEERLMPIIVPIPERTSSGRDEAPPASSVGMALSDDLKMVQAAVGRVRGLRQQLAI